MSVIEQIGDITIKDIENVDDNLKKLADFYKKKYGNSKDIDIMTIEEIDAEINAYRKGL